MRPMKLFRRRKNPHERDYEAYCACIQALNGSEDTELVAKLCRRARDTAPTDLQRAYWRRRAESASAGRIYVTKTTVIGGQ